MIRDWRRGMALGHKAWMESRSVFAACVFVTFANSWLAYDRTYEAVLAKRLANPSPFEILDGTYRVWGIVFSILGAGCLLWERRQGGFAYSLGLPVRAAHFNLMRALVGVGQVAVISVVPTYAAGLLHQALRPEMKVPLLASFSMASVALSIGAFGLAYFAGAILSNLYSAIGLSWVAATGISFLLAAIPATEHLAGMTVLRRMGSMPPKPVSWWPVCAYTAIGLLFIIAGAYLAERRPALEAR